MTLKLDCSLNCLDFPSHHVWYKHQRWLSFFLLTLHLSSSSSQDITLAWIHPNPPWIPLSSKSPQTIPVPRTSSMSMMKTIWQLGNSPHSSFCILYLARVWLSVLPPQLNYMLLCQGKKDHRHITLLGPALVLAWERFLIKICWMEWNTAIQIIKDNLHREACSPTLVTHLVSL